MARYLSVDADVHGLFVAVGNLTRGQFAIERTLVASDGAKALSPSTAVELGGKLKQLLKDAGIAPAPVLLTIGRDRVVLKEIKHPPSPPQDEAAIVRFQALKELTDAPEEVILDYSPINFGNATLGERKALVAFLRKDAFTAAKVFCEVAGLKLASVTPRPFASAAAAGYAIASGAVAAPERADAAIGVLTLGETGGEFTVTRSGQIVFSRSLPGPATASEASLLGELKRNLTVYTSQSGGDAVQAIYLAESPSGSIGWTARLQTGLPVQVHAFDPLGDSRVADTIPAQLRGRFAGVVGQFAAKSGVGPTPINFMQPRQPRASSSPNRSRVLVGVLAGALVLGAIAFGAYLLVEQSNRKVAYMKAQVEQADNDLKALEMDGKRLAAAEEFDARQVVWLDELYDVADRFPDITKMKLTSFLGTALPPPTEKEKEKEKAALLTAPLSTQKKTAPKPVATIKLNVTTDSANIADRDLAEKLVQTMDAARDRYYSGARKTTAGTSGSATAKSTLQQFVIEAQIAHRPATEFTRKITATLPKKAEPAIFAPVPGAKPDNFDPDNFGGGAAP